jgi:hypothetical protein
MRIRGERECQDCGTRWSYYETGSPNCPDCDSLRSVGLDERTRHTASPATLDLTAARELAAADDLTGATERATETCREFVRRQGFVDAGELAALDDTYLAATELRYVAAAIDRSMRTGDDEKQYLHALLGGADRGERPAPGAVPGSLHAARGLACARAVRAYRREVDTYLDDHPDAAASAALGTLLEHVKRVEALDGDVDPETAEKLVRAARGIGTYLREGEAGALVAARERLDHLA